METFLEAMRRCVSGAFFFEDDAILSDRLLPLHLPSGRLIQLFTRSKTDNGGWKPGSSFLANVGLRIPPAMGPSIAEFGETWKRIDKHPTGFDLIIRDYLVATRQQYWQVFPALVDHTPGPSTLGRRAHNRTAPSFR